MSTDSFEVHGVRIRHCLPLKLIMVLEQACQDQNPFRSETVNGGVLEK